MAPQSTTQRLKELVRECTAVVLRDGVAKGTAFFITDHLLLSCAHTFEPAGKYQIQPLGTEDQLDVTVSMAPDPHDLALLRVEWSDLAPPPCVVLDGQTQGDDFYITGYLNDVVVGRGFEAFDVTLHENRAFDGTLQKLVIEAGSKISPGMSGGPVVNLETGAVVALVNSSDNVQRAEGGGAIPIQQAIDSFADVRRAFEEPSTAARRWRDVVGRERWRALGKSWDLDASIDLLVTGTADSWHIDVGSSEIGSDLDGRNLGAGVAEALFRWARRRRPRSDEDVELLGRLLSEALFPPDVAKALRDLGGADKVTIRLIIERGSALSDIPWELAAVPANSKKFLSAEPEYRFVRVLDDQVNSSGQVAGRNESVRVLAVVVQPKLRYPVSSSKWPPLTEIAHRILLPEVQRLEVESPLQNPLVSAVENRLSGRQGVPVPAILHYIGVGRLSNDVPEVALFADKDEYRFEPVATLLNLAADAGVRVVVLQFTEMPVDKQWEPIPSSSIATVLPEKIEALVTTSVPVHPNQLAMFNDKFYRRIAEGDSVDGAVQAGRKELNGNNPVQDASGFAFFTVVTGSGPEVVLIEPSPVGERPSEHGPAAAGHSATGERPVIVRERRTGAADDFVG